MGASSWGVTRKDQKLAPMGRSYATTKALLPWMGFFLRVRCTLADYVVNAARRSSRHASKNSLWCRTRRTKARTKVHAQPDLSRDRGDGWEDPDIPGFRCRPCGCTRPSRSCLPRGFDDACMGVDAGPCALAAATRRKRHVGEGSDTYQMLDCTEYQQGARAPWRGVGQGVP